MTARQFIRKLIALLALGMALAGCQPYLHPVQEDVSDQIRLQEGSSFGQTFVAAYDGLEGVQYFLTPGENEQGELLFSLYPSPLSAYKLASGRLPVEQVDKPAYYNFNFPSLNSSQGEYYYATLEIEGAGELAVQLGPSEAYRDGSAYQADLPLEAQARFRLSYDLQVLLTGLAAEVISWIWPSLLGILVFVLPGWGLLRLVYPPAAKLSLCKQACLGSGLSLAVYPLLMLWTNLVGLQLGTWNAWLPAGFGAAWLIWRAYHWLRHPSERPDTLELTAGKDKTAGRFWPAIALIIVLDALVVTRFWAIRNLEAPMWGDSVQHTLIAQLMLDNGGLFSSWEPYTPYQTLTVQYGFPAVAAVFSWISGFSSWQATLYTGQLLNILAVASLYPLAVRLSGKRWSGVIAVLIAGLVSSMPAMYVNWGRYAQLTGQAILPAALWLLWEALETSQDLGWSRGFRKVVPLLVLAGFVLSGMSLGYYRMPFFYATFAVALLVSWSLPRWRMDFRRWGWGAASLAVIALAAALLILPWGARLLQGSVLAGLVQSGVETSSPLQNVLADYRGWLIISEFVPTSLLVLGSLALVLSLWRRELMVAGVGLWVGCLASLVALSLLRIPGTNMMQNFTVIIALYIPISLVIGWLAGMVLDLLPLRSSLGQAGITALIAIVAAWLMLGQRNMAQPDTFAMVTRPDIQAMTWIQENTPADSRFLVEGFRVYNTSAVGSDAGWWIPLLAGRQNTMPPQYALMNEAPLVAGYSLEVAKLVELLEEGKPDDKEVIQALCRWGISHVYIGQRQGKVSVDGFQLFSPAEFSGNPYFTQIYHVDQVHIFALEQDVCN